MMTKLREPRGLDTPPPPLSARLYDYFRPIVELGLSIYYFFLTLLDSPTLLLSDLQAFHYKAFGKFWSAYGAAMSAGMPDGTAELMASSSGLVLDVGPGSGTQVQFFDPEKITMLYGVEPVVDLHAKLRQATEKAGFQGKYDVVTAGAELEQLVPELAKRNLFQDGKKEGIFDTVVCIRVLCGVPDHFAMIDGLYRLLKPGGRFIVCEHVLQPYPKGGDFIASLLQKFYMVIGWSFWVGGCCMDRDTDAALRKVAGPNGWDKIEATYLSPYSTVPYLVGEYVKAK